MSFQDNDLVRVIRQPEEHHVQLLGAVGYVEPHPTDGYVVFHAINLAGDITGAGTLPADCVELCRDPEWVAAHNGHDQKVEFALALNKTWNDGLDAAKARVAEQAGLSLESVQLVLDLWEQERPQHPYAGY